MDKVSLFFQLLWGSIVYRPYVYAFFTCFLVFSLQHLGWKRAFTFLVSAYLIAYVAEYSSTRNGFPFGPYTYEDSTRARELWISNVPFWDSLSFVFLSYFSFMVAAAATGNLNKLTARVVPWAGGLLMMLLDVVIDPVALQGKKWFLGQIYHYPYQGFYFGVTAANFAGWFFVGWASQFFFQWCLQTFSWCKEPWRKLPARFKWGVYGVYAGVFAFNLVITVMIRDYALAAASAATSALTLAVVAVRLRRVSWTY